MSQSKPLSINHQDQTRAQQACTQARYGITAQSPKAPQEPCPRWHQLELCGTNVFTLADIAPNTACSWALVALHILVLNGRPEFNGMALPQGTELSLHCGQNREDFDALELSLGRDERLSISGLWRITNPVIYPSFNP